MKIKIIKKPGRVLSRSLSMWCQYIGIALAGASSALPYVTDYLPPAAILSISIGAALFARIIDQGGLDNADQ